MPTAQVNGIGIYYEVHGSGDPLVLIGGLGADVSLAAGWRPGQLVMLAGAAILAAAMARRSRAPQLVRLSGS